MQVLKQQVLGRLHELPSTLRDTTLTELLRDLHTIKEPARSELVASLTQLRFVPCGSGELKLPGELYDGCDSHLPPCAVGVHTRSI